MDTQNESQAKLKAYARGELTWAQVEGMTFEEAKAIAALRDSTLAREAFGDDVIAHYLNMAEVEQRAYDMAVTDWEIQRYFERI